MSIGILLALVGLGLIVVSRATPRRALATPGLGLLILGVVAAVAFASVVVVPAGNVGVVFNAVSGVKANGLEPGAHFLVPGLESVVLYPTRLQELTLARQGEGGPNVDESIKARSKEGLEISVDITVQFRVPAAGIAQFHKDPGPNYVDTVIRPQVRSKVRDAIGQFSAADLISTQRTELEAQVNKALGAAFTRSNLELVGLLLREIRIPDSVAKVIEEKQTAEQQVAIERNKLQQANIQAQRAVVQAQGEAKAAVARAEGEAKALQLRGTALKSNPELIQLTFAEKLSPSVQTIMMPSSGNFLFNLADLSTAGKAATTATR
ncbi:MAG TPA: prohibitin family protein [Deinococcales bacterium]|nr:prohibitin family protein [Deinococcales bacterium]